MPEHWQSGPLQRWFAIVNGGTPASAEEAYWDGTTVWLTPDDLGQNEGAWIGSGRRTITEEGVRNSSARVTPAGSIVLSTRAPIGHLAITGVPAATNQGCRTLIPSSEADGCYAYYALLASRPVLQSLGKGSTFMELTPNDLGGHGVPLPPLDEQRAIAAYLDRETERIDALVAKKRLLIERLEEYRTALITRTVTRGLPPEAARAAGLDPSPRLKPSGVEWLGDAPEHWEVLKPSFGFGRIGSGTTPRSDAEEYYDGDTPWVTTSELREDTILETAKSVTAAALREHTALHVYPAGALVIAMYGATIGRLGILGVPATVNQACCVFAQPTRLRTRFVYYWLLGFREVLISHSAGGGQPNLSQEDLRALRIPAPPTPEQDRIGDYLDAEVSRLDGLASEIDSAIERLQEYRAALITAAVTGKVDVRE